MEPVLMYGQPVADKILDEVKSTMVLHNEWNRLAIVSVGDDAASEVYMRNKLKTAEKCGIDAERFHFDDGTSCEEIMKKIFYLNRGYDGVIVQLPLPRSYSQEEVTKIINSVRYSRDVDCLTEEMTGAFYAGRSWCNPCTPQAVMDILEYYGIPLKGKNVVVIGRSHLVGRPVAELMLRQNATVTICHSQTTSLGMYTRTADIIVCAAGVPKLITADMVKEGVVIVDVSINRVDGKLCGDVDFDNVAPKCAAITPVPKGVGPVTVAELMRNVVGT